MPRVRHRRSLQGNRIVNRRTETILIALGVAIFACLLAMPFVLGDGPPHCRVCGERVTFTVYDKASNEKLHFCTAHGKQYRDRQPKPDWPEEELTPEEIRKLLEKLMPEPLIPSEPACPKPRPQTQPAEQ